MTSTNYELLQKQYKITDQHGEYFVTLREMVQAWIEKQEESHPGLSITNTLESELARLYDELTQAIESGETPTVAIQEWEKAALAALELGITDGWQAGRLPENDGEGGEEDSSEAGIIAGLVATAAAFLAKFAAELVSKLTSQPTIAGMLAILQANRARALMYAGESWAAMQQGKTHNAPPDSLWEWVGPFDHRNCKTCSREVKAGPRRLSQMTILPGRDTECFTNCRHEIKRVRK